MELTHASSLTQPRALFARNLVMCGLVTPLSFGAGILVAASEYPGYSHVTQAISELGAVGAPFPIAQALNFWVAGVLTAAFAIGLGQDARLRPGATLFGTLGVMMFAHGLLPCDAGCEFVTWVGSAHNVTGVVGFLAAIAGVWICGRQAPGGAYRIYSAGTAALALAGFVLWIALAKGALIAQANGSLQRFFVFVLLAWMFVTAWRQARVLIAERAS